MNYILLVLISLALVFYIFYSHITKTNKELKKQNTQLHSQVIKEKIEANIKEFQAIQKTKKEQIVKDNKDVSKTNGINLSVGNHTLDF